MLEKYYSSAPSSGDSKRRPAAAAVKQAASSRSRIVKMETIHLAELPQNAMRSVLQDNNLRKLVSSIHPVGVMGCIIAPMLKEKSMVPKTIPEVFSRESLEFVTLEGFLRRFPIYPASDPKGYSMFTKGPYSPHTHAFVFYVIPESEATNARHYNDR